MVLESWRNILPVLMVSAPVACNVSAHTTIHVPADDPTIQSAIDAAKNGDTVLVSPGTYNENLDFKGKAITVTTGRRASLTPPQSAVIGSARLRLLSAYEGSVAASAFRSDD